MTRSLQSLVEEQLAELPRLLANKLVRDKLEATGHGGNDELLAAIVDRLLSDANGARDEADDDFIETETEAKTELELQFTAADYERILRFTNDISEALPGLIHTIAAEASCRMLHNYERDWAHWRPSVVTQTNEFRTNLELRWNKGFDALRMLIELSRDIGADFHSRARRSRSNHGVHLNKALSRLHIRAIQISSEMMVLMENGYADGAMARWRTLHEVACVAMVLDEGGEALAERYLAHEIVEARKALLQYRQCHKPLGYAPFSKRESTRIERDYAAALARFGKEFGEDYGWVAAHLGILRPKFSHIEAAAGRAMMRSHYKMASHNIHASAKGIAYRLGSLDRRFSVIGGASNVGFVEPGQNLALSLLHITMLMLPKRWTLDKIAQLMVIIELQQRVPRALVRSERAIEKDEQAITKTTETAASKTK